MLAHPSPAHPLGSLVSRVRRLSVPFRGCASVPLEWPRPLCVEYPLLSTEHAANRPHPVPPSPAKGLSLDALYAVNLSVPGTHKFTEEGGLPGQCPASSKVEGAPMAPERGL